MNKSYFISGDIVGQQKLVFLRKGIVCLLVKILFLQSLVSRVELGRVLYSFCAYSSHGQWACLSQLSC